MTIEVRRLGPDDAERMRALNALFASAFGNSASYVPQPSEPYFRRVLGRDQLIVLTALDGESTVGGLVAYVLDKLEQERREIYIYDLAVAKAHRRQGIATALICTLQDIATTIGAWVIFVQADHGDDPAIALYEKLGTREDVMHFDIPPRLERPKG